MTDDYEQMVKFEHVRGCDAHGVNGVSFDTSAVYCVDNISPAALVKLYKETVYKRIDDGIDENDFETYRAWRCTFKSFMASATVKYHSCECGKRTLCQPLFRIKRVRNSLVCVVECGCDIVKIRIWPDQDEHERFSYTYFCSTECESTCFARILNEMIAEEIHRANLFVTDPNDLSITATNI